MDKLKMHSVNKVEENIEKIGTLFPNALTEVIKGYREDGSAIIEHAIDFDVLRQELSSVVVEGPEERYQFTWPDKKKSILLANAPIAKTLRPCREESVDFDSTENLYIEGDNLDALKLLQETYLGKVKMVYIDPPYNTGNDFVYEDNFAQDTDEYLANSGQYDDDGNRLVQNTESNGRFHTDWLNMIYPRLRLAKDLLSDDGVVFISIDDNEVENLRKICSEVFGAQNFICNAIWEKKFSPQNDAKWLSDNHDHVLIYAKNKMMWHPNKLNRTDESNARFSNPDNDPRGVWASSDMTVKTYSADYDYPIITPSGREVWPTKGRCWSMPQSKVYKLMAEGRIWFGKNSDNVPRIKTFLSEIEDSGIVPMTIWKYTEVGHNQEARQEFKALFDGSGYFDGPKPIRLIKHILTLGCNKESIILDFFSGSATTAHAVMQLNAEDGGNRKFVMVQLQEATDEKSEAFKAGYKNISEIGKERIRRAGKKILEEHPEASGKLDIGFRVLKVDSTNMQDVYYKPAKYSQDTLFDLADNIKPDRTPEDLLFQVMLDLGVLLSSKSKETAIGGKKVFSVADGYLMACFDSDVTSEVITEIAKKQPYYAVFRDSGMASDSVATNFEQIFETYSPTTVRKVL